jgi:fructuronate reductase
MRLSLEGIMDRKSWEDKGISLPRFDIETVRDKTRLFPEWLHMGAGNIFRVFPAAAQQTLLNDGFADTGIIVCEAFDEEIADASFTPYDNLCVGVTFAVTDTVKSDSFVALVIASVTECLKASAQRERLAEIFRNPSLRMVSFTITEKGYAVYDGTGGFLPHIAGDIAAGPQKAASIIGITAALCLERFRVDAAPLALVSMDNCSENGDQLKNAVSAVARGWVEGGYVSNNFLEYLRQPDKGIAFPWSMIDKITPRPSDAVKARLEEMGLEGMDIVCTSKNTYVAPFVNAEETQYLVIEDTFPNGRPPLEKAGFIFTDRETVKNVEAMKVGACLNPLHSVLAVFGSILGCFSIHETMGVDSLVNLIKVIGYKEALPWVPDPGIICPEDFLDKVINVRLPNPHIPDTPQRIATDTSQKIPVRFGGTLKKMAEEGGDIAGLRGVPFFFAGWLRYLLAVDDCGNVFKPSPDPMLSKLMGYMKDITLGCGDDEAVERAVKPILSNPAIFGLDLYSCGLADKVINWFRILIKGRGAVKTALDKEFS